MFKADVILNSPQTSETHTGSTSKSLYDTQRLFKLDSMNIVYFSLQQITILQNLLNLYYFPIKIMVYLS